MILDNSKNFGIQFKMKTEISTNVLIFCSTKYKDKTKHPQLIIEYEDLPQTKTINKVLCAGKSIEIFNKTYNRSGTFLDTTTINGVKIFATINIKTNEPVIINELKTLCPDSLLLTIGDKKIGISGIFTNKYKTNVGCDSTVITTVTKKERCETCDRVFIPNVFSPNQDGYNDAILVFGEACVHKVDLFQVFDLWGNLLFEKQDFLPNDPLEGWNGYFRNRLSPQGTYTYSCVVSRLNGTTKKLKGTFNLMY